MNRRPQPRAERARRGARIAAASRRGQVLDVAFRQLVKYGFEGLRIREVAAEVGINQATLLYHFRDKEELIVALVDELVARMRGLNEGESATVLGSPGSLGAFESHLRTLLELFSSNPSIYVAFNEIGARAIRDRRIAAKLAAVEEDWMSYIASLLGAPAPDAPRSLVEALARSTVIYVRGLVAKAAGDGTLAVLLARRAGRAQAQADLNAAVDTLLDLVRARLADSHGLVSAGLRNG
jgi:AcrR family transcriptional regulator